MAPSLSRIAAASSAVTVNMPRVWGRAGGPTSAAIHRPACIRRASGRAARAVQNSEWLPGGPGGGLTCWFYSAISDRLTSGYRGFSVFTKKELAELVVGAVSLHVSVVSLPGCRR